jgi:hypothetical protein
MTMLERFKSLAKSRRGSITMGWIILMSVGLLLVAILFPIAIAEIESYTPTDATTATVWSLLGVFAVLAIAIKLIRDAAE